MTKEKLIKAIMAECEKDGEPVTLEEATEMAEMELKAGTFKRYEQATVEKKKVKREIKKDLDKIELINTLFNVLNLERKDDDLDISNLAIKNDQREITFNYNGAEYSLTLTKHRPPKK